MKQYASEAGARWRNEGRHGRQWPAARVRARVRALWRGRMMRKYTIVQLDTGDCGSLCILRLRPRRLQHTMGRGGVPWVGSSRSRRRQVPYCRLNRPTLPRRPFATSQKPRRKASETSRPNPCDKNRLRHPYSEPASNDCVAPGSQNSHNKRQNLRKCIVLRQSLKCALLVRNFLES